MSKKPAAVKAPKTDVKIIKRMRRNAMTRQCLPKFYKSMFAGSDHATWVSILAAWRDGRKKVSIAPMGSN